MTATINAIADAVATALNAADWPIEFTAVRSYQPTFELQQMSELKVSVVPPKVESVRAARGLWEQLYTVEIGVQKRPEELTNAYLDPLVELAEAIAIYWETHKDLTAGGRQFRCMTVVTETVAYPDDLAERQMFTSVVCLTFKGWR